MGVQERVDIVVSADTYAGKKLLEDMAASFDKIGRSGDDAAGRAGNAFGRLGADIGRFALGMAGAAGITQVLSTAVSKLTAEYDQFINRSTKAANAQLDFADAERRMVNVLGDMDRRAADARLLAIASKTGVAPAQLALAAASALSGKGETLPDSAAFAAVEEAALFAPGPRTQAGELSGLASAILMTQKDDPSLTARQAMALISNVARADRAESIEDLAKYMFPTIIRGRAFGGGQDDVSYLAALGTAVGQRAEDPSGQATSTAVESFLKQIKLKTLPHVGRNASVREQYEFLMTTPQGAQLRRELLGGLFDGDIGNAIKGESSVAAEIGRKLLGEDIDLKTGKGRMLIPLVELLQDADNLTKRTMRANMAAIPSPHDPRSVAMYNALQAEHAANPFQQAAQMDMALAGANQGLLLPNRRGGAIGVLNRQLPELLQANGVSAIKQDLVMAQFRARAALAEDREGVIDAGISALEAGLTPETRMQQVISFWPKPPQRVPNKLTPEEKETNALLRELIDKLSKQKITIESGGEEQRGRIGAEGAGR